MSQGGFLHRRYHIGLSAGNSLFSMCIIQTSPQMHNVMDMGRALVFPHHFLFSHCPLHHLCPMLCAWYSTRLLHLWVLSL